MKKIGIVILGLLLLSSLAVYPFRSIKIANAQSTSSEPNWAALGVTFSYGWQLWEYFPTSNLSSAISSMEQDFTLGSASYTPEKGWTSVFDFKLISADSQQGVFQITIGSQTATLNYIWSNQTWLMNGQQQDFLPIYFSPAQLSGNPLITIGSYQAYKVSRQSSTNRTLYDYYQKDTGILLLLISVQMGQNSCDLGVMGLISTSIQIPQTITTILPVPYDYQSDTNWCGLASLAMVLNYYNISAHCWQIAAELGISKDSGSIEARSWKLALQRFFNTIIPPTAILSDYIEKYYPQLIPKPGYYDTVDQVRKAVENNVTNGYPLILQLANRNGLIPELHFVVAVGFNSTGLFVNDPSGALVYEWLNIPVTRSLIRTYVSWQDITPFLIFKDTLWGLESQVASTLAIESSANPMKAKLGINLVFPGKQIIRFSHNDTMGYSQDVTLDMNKGLVWVGSTQALGLVVKHFPIIDDLDTIVVPVQVYSQSTNDHAMSVTLRLIGSNGKTYYTASQSENNFIPFSSGWLLQFKFRTPQDLAVDQYYIFEIALQDQSGKTMDSIFLPPIPYGQSGTLVQLSESQHRLYLQAYDSSGRHTGINDQTGKVELGIPGSLYEEYSDNQSVIFLPSNVTQFRYVVDAHSAEYSTESYMVEVCMLNNNTIVKSSITNATIQKGEQVINNVAVDFTQQSISITPQQAPWWQQYWYVFVVVAALLALGVVFWRKKVVSRR